MKVLIVGSGSAVDPEIIKNHYKSADLVIAADGGAAHLIKSGLMPHVLMGDLDSVPEPIIEEARKNQVHIMTYPTKKDFTDMELAVDLAVERGAHEVAILGATGSRLDHTMANIHLLIRLLEKGIRGFLEDEKNRIYLINREITLKKQVNRKVSLLPLYPCAKGVTTYGLAYELSDATLYFGTGRGVSNEFCEETASITLNEGLLLVFVSED